MELEALLSEARRGDRAAWNALLERLRPILRALLRRQVCQAADASDLTQEVQMRMDRGFGQFRGESVPQLLAWVRQIAARVLIDHRRKRPPAEALPVDPPDPGCGPGLAMIQAEDLARLAAALDELPETHRMVIEARLLEGLRCVDVARRLGRSPEWVRVKSWWAVKELQEKLGTKP